MFRWLSRLLAGSVEEKETAKTPVLTAEQGEQTHAAPLPSAPITTEEEQTTLPSLTWMQREEMNAALTAWLFGQNESSALFLSAEERNVLDSLDTIVRSNQSGADLVRRMPGVIPQLLQSLRTEDFSGAELARKIGNDVVLVAAVIRIANSSINNPSKPVTSIEHAVIVLGHTGLRQLITSVAFKPIIDLKSGAYTRTIAPRLWQLSERCAIANRRLASDAGLEAFDCFLAGLLQYVGLIVALRIMDQITEGQPGLGSEAFCTALFTQTRALSCSIAREWNFPPAIARAIEEQGQAQLSTYSPSGQVLALGDYLSKAHTLARHSVRLAGNVDPTSSLDERLREHLPCLEALPAEP